MNDITHTSPKPLFDTLEEVVAFYKTLQESENSSKLILDWLQECLTSDSIMETEFIIPEFQLSLNFLYSYRGSPDTFNAYRRELERFVTWCWFIKKTAIVNIKRLDIEEFIEFSQQPPLSWIGTKTVARFQNENGRRIPNPEWRPFIVKVSKAAFQVGKTPNIKQFKLSNTAIKQIFTILSSFYQFLIQEEATEANPLMQVRQKSKFLRKEPTLKQIRRLSDTQWAAVLKITAELAEKKPDHYERSLFILSCLYGMYLRISELASSSRWSPKMGDFFRDADNNWWFKTVGKGNKFRQIAVSPLVLTALKRYRTYLGLTPLPHPEEDIPLISKEKNSLHPISSTRPIRKLVQECFDSAIAYLISTEQIDEADMLKSATVHWLRHTGISDDVKHRPREHVRDDAGHSSSAITDRYIDVALAERAKSAKNKR